MDPSPIIRPRPPCDAFRKIPLHKSPMNLRLHYRKPALKSPQAFRLPGTAINPTLAGVRITTSLRQLVADTACLVPLLRQPLQLLPQHLDIAAPRLGLGTQRRSPTASTHFAYSMYSASRAASILHCDTQDRQWKAASTKRNNSGYAAPHHTRAAPSRATRPSCPCLCSYRPCSGCCTYS